jgi:hypothetical protein
MKKHFPGGWSRCLGAGAAAARPTLVSVLALACAVFLLRPSDPRAFTTIGGSLDTNQRDVRVFDNFADSESNNNTTFIPQFPGTTGLEQAAWKAIVEWGSLAHGDGGGDPTQPQIGSGGANFDPSWQGSATEVGGTDSNTISAISSCAGGTLAFTETPIDDGWRIRFCDGFTWHDGPGTISGTINNFDIQGVGTHEYGHALGLGHTLVAGATMRPNIPAADVTTRSIEDDDIMGVQFLYGVASPGKPVVTSVSGTTMLTILGANFAASDNEVWFTQSGMGGNGNPIKALNVPSTAGGTSIALALPAGAGPGDLLVKSGPGTSGDTLSNAFPFDPVGPPPQSYCTGKLNSNFCLPTITFSGIPSASSSSAFEIIGIDVMPNQLGLLLYGTSGRGNIPFHNAKLCIRAPHRRHLPMIDSGSTGTGPCPGVLRLDFNLHIQSGIDPALIPGTRVNAQWIYSDPGIDMFDDGLTNALEFDIHQ